MMYSILAIALFLVVCGSYRVTRGSNRGDRGRMDDVRALYRSRVAGIRLDVVSEVRPTTSGGGNEFYGEEESEIEEILRESLLSSEENSHDDDAESTWVRFPDFKGAGTASSVISPAFGGEGGKSNYIQGILDASARYDGVGTDAHHFVHTHVGAGEGKREVADSQPQQQQLKKKASKQELTNYAKRKSLLKTIKGHIRGHRISKMLSCLRDKTGGLSLVEMNYLATDTIRCLGAPGSGGAGAARHCTDVLRLMEGMGMLPDMYTYTAER